MVSKESGEEEMRRRRRRRIRGFLGLGFCVQGFRCFPWTAIVFFLKDSLNASPSTLQLLQNSANLPMVGKPLYGVVSDAVYVGGQHRIPYIAVGAFLQAVSWLAIATLSSPNISIFSITIYLLLSNLGASIVEVANDAIVAELGKQKQPSSSSSSSSSSSGELQSFVWMASSAGGVLGNLAGGVAIDRFPPHAMFFAFGVLLAVQFLVTTMVSESSLDLPRTPPPGGVRRQLRELAGALGKPEISYSISWFAASYAAIPALTGTMFFYQTRYLNIDSSVLGISKVFGQAAMLAWSIVYNRYLKSVPVKKVISYVQVTMALLMFSDFLFVTGVYRHVGVPDSVYVVFFSGFLEVLYFFKILPFSVLVAQLCPRGCEGSLMAFLMAAVALAFIVSGYLGVALASCVGVTADDFSGMPVGLLVQAACTMVPLFWCSCIPEEKPRKVKKKD